MLDQYPERVQMLVSSTLMCCDDFALGFPQRLVFQWRKVRACRDSHHSQECVFNPSARYSPNS